jgi:hypothetical protein
MTSTPAIAATASRNGSAASMPRGFFPVKASSMVPGERASARTAIGMAVPAIHATGRHRREGGRPSGNSSRSNVPIKAMLGIHDHVETDAASNPPGRAPGRVSSA